MTLEGKDEAFRKMELMATAEFAKASVAFWDVCRGVILPASSDECPVDTGVLQASAQACSWVEYGEGVTTAFLGYGGAAKDYALPQHEHLEYHHTVGKAKFLEDPVRRIVPNSAELVRARMEAMQ